MVRHLQSDSRWFIEINQLLLYFIIFYYLTNYQKLFTI